MEKIIKKKLNNLKLSNKYRIRKIKDSGNSHLFIYKNKEYLSFASNDYLSLSNDKRIIRAAKKALDKYGYSTGSSALISGYTKSHYMLEEELSEFLGQEKTLLFSTGYQANLGVIKSLVNKSNNIISDKLNHASLIDGGLYSGAHFKRYLHNDIQSLEKKLSSISSEGSNSEISKLIEETDKLDIKPSMIQPLNEIKSLGKFKVKIILHSEIDSEITINVITAETIQ